MKIILAIAVLLSISEAAFCTTPHAYVTEFGGNSVSIIDVNRDTVQRIFGFSKPHIVRVTFDGTASYVGDSDNNIYKITCIEHTVEKIATLSSKPIALCIKPDASILYVATKSSVNIIDLVTNEVVAEIECVDGPQDIRCTHDGKYVYVTNKGNGTISVIDATSKTLATTITGLNTPVGIMFDVDGNFAYVSDSVNNAVYVIDLSNNLIVATVLGFSNPTYIARSPDKTVAYVSNTGNDTVSILRLSDNFILGSIPIPIPGAIATSPDGLYLYVASGFNEVFKIKTLDHSIQLALQNFKSPSNVSFTDNNAPPDTVNGWQVVTNPLEPYNQVSWKAPAGNPYQYRIFKDSNYQNLLTTIPNSGNLLYNDNHKRIGQTYSYYVLADYDNGFSSTIGEITVSPNRVGLPR